MLYLVYVPLRLRARYTSYLAAPETAFHFSVGRPWLSLPPVTAGADRDAGAQRNAALVRSSLPSEMLIFAQSAAVPA